MGIMPGSLTGKSMGCVALTVWEDRISPVFDAAHDLMLVTIDGGKISDRRVLSFDPDRLPSLLAVLADRHVECLICGAISEMPARMIIDSGIRLVPFITGNLSKVLDRVAKGEPIVPVFLMPGCGCPRRNTCTSRRRRAGQRNDENGHES